MNVTLAFMFFALGIAADAVHHGILRSHENKAYSNGYAQAQKEEEIRRAAAAQQAAEMEAHVQLRAVNPSRIPDAVMTMYSDDNSEAPNFPDDFWGTLQTNGRATAQIRRERRD